ncbi:MAG: phage baseplate assembly protein V, partial [Bryobacteraceae bacterium]
SAYEEVTGLSSALFEQLENIGTATLRGGFAIAPGIVLNNFDAMGEGRVQVRIPSVPALEPWARVVAPGAGPSRGLFWIPQVDDEVLVGFAQNDVTSAYVLGGLWSTIDRPPALSPTDALNKRIVKTGVAGGLGHEIEIDDVLQSIKITSSTQQKITIDPLSIKIETTGGVMSITLDQKSQTITLQSALKIALKATQISLEAAQIELKGATISIQASGPCTVLGAPIKLN